MKYIHLSKGLKCIVDDEDYEKFASFKWFAHKSTSKHYAARSLISGRRVLLHREIIGIKTDYKHIKTQVDHINSNSLDNRKSNLRICSNSQNSKNRSIGSNNRSGYKGVFFHKRSKSWQAMIRVDGKRLWLGSFKNKKDAAIKYNQSAKENHGEYAKINFV